MSTFEALKGTKERRSHSTDKKRNLKTELMAFFLDLAPLSMKAVILESLLILIAFKQLSFSHSMAPPASINGTSPYTVAYSFSFSMDIDRRNRIMPIPLPTKDGPLKTSFFLSCWSEIALRGTYSSQAI